MPREFKLPDLGEGITEAQVVRLMIAEGDQVEEDQALMEVETDKAAVEIPSPFAGVAEKLHVEEGQTVNVGDVMVTFADDGAAPAKGKEEEEPEEAEEEAPKKGKEKRPKEGEEKEEKAKKEPAPKAEKEAEKEEAHRPRARGGKKKTVPAAPAVRKMARQMGVDLTTIRGTGPGGRVLREDVQRAADGAAEREAPPDTEIPMAKPPKGPEGPPPGVEDADKWGPVRRLQLTQIRKTIAKQMARSAYTAPHVTHTDDADVTELDRIRRGYSSPEGEPERKVTLMPFVIKACAQALKKYPEFNSSFDDESQEIVFKDYISIGIAVDTERGLIVPVLRNVAEMSILDLTDALVILAEKTRRTQFTVEELRGGTFTITNYGALGGRYGTPIINYPEVAILGLGRSRWEPAVRNGEIVPRNILPMSLSFDHRVTDGAQAARFVRNIVDDLENPARLLL